MNQPWERREGETPKAFAAFCVYRNMGASRSIEKVSEKYQKSIAIFNRWSQKDDWVYRAGAYDEYLAKISVQSVEEGIRQDRITYRDTVKREAAEFAEAAVKMREDAMRQSDRAEGSLMLQRASSVWEKARQVEGMALGLVSE